MGNPLQGHRQSVNSVAFPPDGRHIVSGSLDETIQVWDAQISSWQVDDDGQNKDVVYINLSSSKLCALQNAQSLFTDSSDDEGSCLELINVQKNGWIMGPNGKLWLWVPPSYHPILLYPWTELIIPMPGVTKLDLSKMRHGTSWAQCYSPTANNT